jgi:hypothetical protein
MKLPFFVGSLPFQSVEKAIQFVKDNSSHLPFLPQLPELNPQEDMIGQVLKGFELGYWDETASIALEAFQNEFCESPRFKIQIAGPYTVSRTLSLPVEEIYPQWEKLVLGISKQLRQGAFLGELWLQIDEPYWPPKGTAYLLEKLRGKIPKAVLGIHSCATERPRPEADELALFQFFSLDCSRTPFSETEREFWGKWMDQDPRRVFAWGHPSDSPHTLDPWALSRSQIWLSAPCGLYGQSL